MDVPPISPILFYRDARKALDFLERAFGFETRMVVDDGQGGVIHSESTFEGCVVMVCGPPPPAKYASPLDFGGKSTGSIHVQVKVGLDALCERARAAGAVIEREPADQPYGDRVFTCFDPEGHAWSFGQEIKAMTADEMTAATGHKVATSLEGRLELPTTDAKAAEAELIAYAATFPGAWEDHPWDHTVMKVGKKVFVFFGGAASPPGEISLTVKLPISYEMALTLPYMSPAGHGLWKGGWAALRQRDGEPIDLETIRGWIDQSYRAVATKRLVKQLDGQGA